MPEPEPVRSSLMSPATIRVSPSCTTTFDDASVLSRTIWVSLEYRVMVSYVETSWETSRATRPLALIWGFTLRMMPISLYWMFLWLWVVVEP